MAQKRNEVPLPGRSVLGVRHWLLIAAMIVALGAVESVIVHDTLTSRVPGSNDFYSRWYGARALLVEDRNPYSLEVTEEIQRVLGINPEQIGRGGFNYPLYVVFTFWPLVYLPYAWAQAIWLVTLQWVALAAAFVLLRLQGGRLSPLGLAALLLGTLFFYPVARSIFLGQFTLHVILFLALALLMLRSERDGWAGICLAATSIKPQLVMLVGPWLVLWAIGQRRWRFIAGLLGGGVGLLLSGMLLYPPWPLAFVKDVLRYSRVAGGRNPLVVLQGLVWPGGPEVVRYGLAALLVLAMLAAWWRGWRRAGTASQQAVHWTLVVSVLVPFQTGSTNQVLVLIPLAAGLHTALQGRRRWPVVALVAVLELALWTLFLATIHGDWEDPIMFLPVPLIGLAVVIGAEIRLWRAGRQRAPSGAVAGAE